MGATKFHLYTSLGVTRESSVEEITRAYRKLALQYHPDRNPEGVEQFKAISNAYAILSDADRRAVYDMTGFVSDSAVDEAHNMTTQAERQQRSAELADQVHNFFATYAGSEEERNDVMMGYKKCNGNFRKMVREYLLFDNGVESEVQRLYRLVKKLVADGKLQPTAAWRESSTLKNVLKVEGAMRREREEAEEALKELTGGGGDKSSSLVNGDHGDGGLGALQLAIRQRQESSYQSMLNNLEAKYVINKRNKKGSTSKRLREAEAETDAKEREPTGNRSEKKTCCEKRKNDRAKRSKH